MGRSLKHLGPAISLENNHPGCISGILHLLHRHHRNHVMKMLPAKRHGNGRHASVDGNPGSCTVTSDGGEEKPRVNTETDSSLIEGKTTESVLTTKNSMKSRIKALFSEDTSKRKNRHRRVSSCPTKIPQTNSIHHLALSDLNHPGKLSLTDENVGIVHQGDENSVVTGTLGPLVSKGFEDTFSSEKVCSLCSALLIMNAKEESKLFLDSLDIVSARKELVKKILQDMQRSFPHHLHSQQRFNSKAGLTRSVSFPICGSSVGIAPQLNNNKREHGTGSCTEEEIKFHAGSHDKESAKFKSAEDANDQTMQFMAEEYVTSKPFLIGPESSSDSSSSGKLKPQHENKLVRNHFKILRRKIKHAIRESKKERYRIMVDAVLHKIPYGRRFSKDRENALDQLKETAKKKHSGYISGSSCSCKGGGKCIRRTTSFNESLERYGRLFESTLNGEAAQHISEGSRSRTQDSSLPAGSNPKSLGRILSLPDLRSYFSCQDEESPDCSAGNTSKTASVKFGEQRPLDPSKVPAYGGGHKNIGNECSFCHEHEVGPKAIPSIKMASPSLDSMFSSTVQEESCSPSVLSLSEGWELSAEQLFFDAVECLPKQEYKMQHKGWFPMTEHGVGRLLKVPADMKNKAEFNYVRCILELSGFCKDEFFGAWHYYTDQLVDPSVFEKMETYLLANPNCFGNEEEEEGGMLDTLLLFDLTNEMLLQLYKISYTNCPIRLTRCSYIHRIPVGYRVLEEVWADINRYLSWRPDLYHSLDDAVSRDLEKSDDHSWMNLQSEAEFVGIELEDMIFYDLMEELVCN